MDGQRDDAVTTPPLSAPLDPLERAIAFAIQEAARIARSVDSARPSISKEPWTHVYGDTSVRTDEDEDNATPQP